MAHHTHYTGRAGEYAVASQLLVRGVNVHFPAVDAGVDLIAGESVRIQVKSSRISQSQVSRGHASKYVFNIAKSHLGKDRVFRSVTRDWTKVADFFVFWGIDENRFWIAPSHLITAGHNIILGSISNKFTIDREEIKGLLQTGLTQRDVAQRLSISEVSVSRAVHDWTPAGKPGACFEIVRRENAWHEIISAVGLVNSIESIEQNPKKKGIELTCQT